MKTYRSLLMFLMVVMLLSACNLPAAQPAEQNDPKAVYTAAAETVVAELTKSAIQKPTEVLPTAEPSTQTPAAPTNTPQPAAPAATLAPVVPVVPVSLCDSALFVVDVSVADGTVYSAGATFTKTWRLKNTGTCTWNSSYALVFDSGNSMGGAASIPVSGSVAPGQSVDLSVNLQAPSADGSYTGFWGVTNASGARVPVAGGFGNKSFSVVIKVGSGGSSTDSSGKFAVTNVGFSVARSGSDCSSLYKYTTTATITTNKAGDVTYNWNPSDTSGTPSSLSGTLNFSQAGTQTISFDWAFGGGNKSVTLYIDKPNHQTFGPANLNCP